MNPLKKLASQTAIYGLSTIVGRLLNYLLTPLLTYVFNPAQYGVITEFYAYIAILIILLTYGMETTLFNFTRDDSQKQKVYSTIMVSVGSTTALFFVLVFLFLPFLTDWLNYSLNPEYIVFVALIVGIDAVTAIPFSFLRQQGKAGLFASLKLVNIGINIALTVFWIWYCPRLMQQPDVPSWLPYVYDPSKGVAYVFLANLWASGITLLLFLPGLLKMKWSFDRELLSRMLTYSFPLLLAGLAGMTNETLGRILLKYLLPESVAMQELGIYGACYKLAILMSIFTQTFRYAAEPFFFSHAEKKNAPGLYAAIMKYFVIACTVIFLGTLLNISWIKYFVGEEYWAGLSVVPVLLMANIFLGMFFNLSIWYKLAEKTRFGAYLTFLGAVITIVLNVALIPVFGYSGSAWATLTCYVVMTLVSYFQGQKHYFIPYPVGSILFYLGLSVLLFFSTGLLKSFAGPYELLLNNLLLLLYVSLIVVLEYRKIKGFGGSHES